MKKFNTLKELISYIGEDSRTEYFEEIVSDYLACEGSDIVESLDEEPTCIFEADGHRIGVTSAEVEEDKWEDAFWLDVDDLYELKDMIKEQLDELTKKHCSEMTIFGFDINTEGLMPWTNKRAFGEKDELQYKIQEDLCKIFTKYEDEIAERLMKLDNVSVISLVERGEEDGTN